MKTFVTALAMAFLMMGPLRAAPPVRPHPNSPLATDGQLVYAVAADRRTIVTAKVGASEWAPLVQLPNADVRGLVWVFGRLFIADAASAAIFAVSTTDRDHTPRVLFRGEPLQHPTELTFTGDVVVADPRSGAFFRVIPERDRARVERIELSPAPPLSDGSYIAGWPSGELLLSDGESGVLAQLTDLKSASSASQWTMQERRDTQKSPVTRFEWGDATTAVRRQGYPGVERPGSLAVFNGLVYVVDSESGSVFAAGIHDARAVRLPLAGVGDMKITRLLVTATDIIGLDARSGRIVNWPRLVPTEIRYVSTPAPESLARVYEYLAQRKLLGTRTLTLTGSLAAALRTAGVISRIVPFEAGVPAYLQPTLCTLNPALCRGRTEIVDPAPGASIVVPELYSERYVTAARVTLDGTRSLKAVVDEAIESEPFAPYTSAQYLREANGLAADAPSPLGATTGSFRISREQVRYMVPFEAAEIQRPNTEFRRLADALKSTLRFVPLERVITAAAAADSPHPNDPDCLKAKAAFEQLLKTIDYAPVKPIRAVVVGVGEDKFDKAHPDFVDANGIKVIRDIHADPPGADGDAVPPAPPADGVEPVEWRPFRLEDHGTAVACLIAGRTRPYSAVKGLTSVTIVALPSVERDANALAQDISAALRQFPTTVVNLSLKALSEPTGLLVAIEDASSLALFVVAAPDMPTSTTLCKGQARPYPACWGDDHDNVIVVGGTTLNGKNLFSQSPSGPSVHLFAPAEGYFAAGLRKGYVPVAGTSFATPLVAATAAMLSGLGVDSPALIKQRLIATATVVPLPGLPQWPRLLNVRRATSHIQHSVLTDLNTGADQVVDLTQLDRPISFQLAGSSKTILTTVGDVRRLARNQADTSKFDLAYIDVDKLKLYTVNAPAAQWAFCYQPLNDQEEPAGPEQCGDLAEFKDYVGPIR